MLVAERAGVVELVGGLEREGLDALSARLAMPVRVPAGGISRMPVTPRSSIVSMHRSQRTGLAIWPTSRREHLAAVVDDLAVAVGDQPGARVVGGDRRGRARRGGRRRAPCARCGRRRRRSAGSAGPWPAGRRRAPASCSSGAGGDDLAGAVVVGGGEAVLARSRRAPRRGRRRGRRSCRSAVAAAASAIALPRSRTSTMACSAVMTPAPAAAVSSPTLWPATAPTRRSVGRVREQLERGDQAGGDQQRLGDLRCRGWSSASASVP